MRAIACAPLVLLLPAALPRAADGQALRALPPNVTARLRDSAAAIPLLKRPWVRPVGSLLVPGSGQLAGGQSRGLVYLAAELWIVSRAIESGRSGRQTASQFRTLIFDVARKQFTPTRVDGPWDYYEAAEKFVESGVYNANPGGAFTPEPDTTTFNGSLWLLARRTFFANPDSTPGPLSAPYQAALRFYEAHAVPDQLRYSWRGARLEQDVYRSEIKNSDNAFRARTNFYGALVLNHLVSAIDALISLRLGNRPGAVPRLSIEPGQDGTDVLVFAWSRRF
ncbi:MAG: hypothetical protein ACHQX4_10590 [Gemmatimonadales bacterium]